MNRIQFRTEVGPIEIKWSEQGKLSSIDLLPAKATSRAVVIPKTISDLIEQIRCFFDEGAPIPKPDWGLIDQSGWTDFQKQVYVAISEIPHGETRTYQWVATRMENRGATRAVGQALRKNPVPVLVPCHRVVSVHSLGGFMGKALPTDPEIKIKKALISIEDQYRNPLLSFLIGPSRSIDLESAV
ncbi:MAG: methylated-DNA--[protein]-cysteine S-methyltransferase [Bdellovibrionota bacterium]